jgi:GTP-binding protein
MIPVDSADAQAEYAELRKELMAYSEELGRRPHCVVLTKADLLGLGDEPPSIEAPEAWATFLISSVARSGLSDLMEGLWERTREAIQEEEGSEDDDWWTP